MRIGKLLRQILPETIRGDRLFGLYRLGKRLGRFPERRPVRFNDHLFALKTRGQAMICADAVEGFFSEDGRTAPDDDKILFFRGVPKFVQVDSGRFTGHPRNLYATEREIRVRELTLIPGSAGEPLIPSEGNSRWARIFGTKVRVDTPTPVSRCLTHGPAATRREDRMMTARAISILTSTYNRAHLLHRAYDSLMRQKTRDFEWVVVDDGSTDHTPGLLARWQEEADFPIAWYRYDNSRGRNAAVNSGKEFVAGDYTLIMDSDDALLDDALESIAYWRERPRIDANPDAYQQVFRFVDETGTLLGRLANESEIPGETLRKSFREAHYGREIAGEMIGVMKTPVCRKRRSVELTNSEHCPEGVTHNRMSQRYQSIFVDRPIGRCFKHDGEARLTDRWPDAVKWPRGTYLRALAALNDDIDFAGTIRRGS